MKVFHFETDDDTFSCTGKDLQEARANLDFQYVQAGYLTADQAAAAHMTTDGVEYGSWNDFVLKHRPCKNPIIKSAPYDGCMFETFGEELTMVQRHVNDQIFTLVDAENYTYICPGFHIVNRIGYLLVEQPWKPEDLQTTYLTD